MIFKQIDRYVSRSFLVRFVACLLLIAALYVSFDVMKQFDEVRGGNGGRELALLTSYYAHLLPVFLLEVVPGVVLVAAGMVMVRMAKARELLALKANGTSLYRTMAPLFVWALVASVCVFAVREAAGPRFARRSAVLGRVLADSVESQILVGEEARNRRIFIGEYDFATGTMKDVSVIDFYPDDTLERNIRADSAAIGPGGKLLLQAAEVQRFAPDARPQGNPELHAEMQVESDLAVLDVIQAAEDDGEEGLFLRPLEELRRQIRLNPQVPFFRVSFHSRLASFFSPLLLLLVGLPCLVGFERAVNSRFLGVIIAVAVASGLYGLTFVFNSMGTTGALHPVLAGWLPPIIVAAVGLYLFESMLT
jgi:lipopolysaccharide export LptBFGC system permease protein LptF